MPQLLRIGIIGIGFGQHVHLPVFRTNSHCRVTAVCASTSSRARAIASQYKIPKAYGGWKALMKDSEIDAFSVAVPPRLQPAIALAALKRRKPLFCEKPLGLRTQETRRLMHLAKKNRTPAMVNFEFPEIDVWQKARTLFKSGGIGTLRHVTLAWQVETRAIQKRSRSWKVKPAQGGGVLCGFMSHSFYYLEYLLGPIRKLSANIPNSSYLALNLEFANRVPCSVIITNQAYQGSGHRLELYGSTGSLKLINESKDYTKGFSLHWAKRNAADVPEIYSSADTRIQGDGRIATSGRIVERFVRWAQKGVAAHPDFSDGHRVQTLIEKAIASNREQKWVSTI